MVTCTYARCFYPLWYSSSSKILLVLIWYLIIIQKVDELIEKGMDTINPDELGTIYKEVQNHSVMIAISILYIPDGITTVNKKIKNIEPSL